MAVTKRHNSKLSSSTATPAPNASSIWIELVAAVKVVEIEERREIAAGHGGFVFCIFVTAITRYNRSDL